MRNLRPTFGVPTAAAVLILGAIATWFVADAARQAAERLTQRTLQERATRVENQLVERLLACEALLHAGAGFIENSWPLTAEQWRTFTTSIRRSRIYPGLQGVGFAGALDKLTARQIASIQTQLRRTPARSAAHERTAILYLEPLDARNVRAIGFDMMSEPTRRKAMAQARDRAEASLSGRVTLIQEMDAQVQPGFLMYLPIYERGSSPKTIEQRRAALLGFVYSPFRTVDFLGAVLPRDLDVHVQVYDGARIAPAHLLYMYGEQARARHREATRHFSIAGHQWTVVVAATPALIEESQRVPVWAIVAVGSAGTLLMSGLVFAMGVSRQRLRQLTKTLEQRVLERTQALEKANRQLEITNRDLSAFTRSVSHDLRGPLRAIEGYGGLLAEELGTPVSPKVQRNLDAIAHTARRMEAIIDDLLKLASVGQRDLNLQSVALSELVERVLEELDPPQAVVVHMQPSELGLVYVDPGLAMLALRNLLGNALKFSRTRSQPQIWVGCREERGERVFYIRDNGVGFDPSYTGSLFGPFQRLHSEREFEGTGLGLTIVKSVIEKHRGRVWASSELGQGATFYFVIPEPQQG